MEAGFACDRCARTHAFSRSTAAMNIGMSPTQRMPCLAGKRRQPDRGEPCAPLCARVAGPPVPQRRLLHMLVGPTCWQHKPSGEMAFAASERLLQHVGKTGVHQSSRQVTV